MTPERTPRRTHLRALLAVGALLPIGFAACGGDDGPAGATQESAQAAESGDVVVELVAFTPEKLTIDAGDTVTWQQKDAGAHTVTSGTVEQGGAGVTQQPDDRFDSGEIATGDTFEFTFTEAGTYPYFCRLHPATMRGEIQVR